MSAPEKNPHSRRRPFIRIPIAWAVRTIVGMPGKAAVTPSAVTNGMERTVDRRRLRDGFFISWIPIEVTAEAGGSFSIPSPQAMI
jgi:hypothetical protein